MQYPTIDWREATLEENLKEFETYAISYGEESRRYYATRVRQKRNWAKTLRVIAILAGALGGLIPILSQMAEDWKVHLDPAWATVAITVAITAIGLDRFFGFSSGWMRFITTEIKIGAKIEQLRLSIETEKFAWQGEKPTFDKAKAVVSLVTTFLSEIAEIVKDETNTWMIEFQNVLQKFSEELKVSAEAGKLGGINVNIENAELCNAGLTIQLEGNQPIQIHGSTYSFDNLYPKIYRVVAAGKASDVKEGKPTQKELHAETLVNVSPGTIAEAKLSLK